MWPRSCPNTKSSWSSRASTPPGPGCADRTEPQRSGADDAHRRTRLQHVRRRYRCIGYEQLTTHPNIGTGRRDALKLRASRRSGGQRVDSGQASTGLRLVVEKFTGVTLDVLVRAARMLEPAGMRMTSMHHGPKSVVCCVLRYWRYPTVAGSPQRRWTSGKLPSSSSAEGASTLPPRISSSFKWNLPPPGLAGSPSLRPQAPTRSSPARRVRCDIPVMMSSRPSESHDVYLGPGWKWGLGVALNPSDLPHGRPAASGGWAGIFNTFFWVDRTSGIAAGLFMQFLPFFDSGAIGLLHDFETAVYESFRSPAKIRALVDGCEMGPGVASPSASCLRSWRSTSGPRIRRLEKLWLLVHR